MPNIKSAVKHTRSDARKQARNLGVTSELKNLSKKLFSLANEPEKAKALAVTVISAHDKAVSHGIIPKGRANRKKSRIAKFLAKIAKKK